MSLRETPLIIKYWQRIGGTLIEEYPVVSTSADHGYRRIDAVIIPDGENIKAKSNEVSLAGKDIICVQAKCERLGMYLMGQAIFSKKLLEMFCKPRSVLSVALCTADDNILRPLLEEYNNVEVVIIERD
jgi:hypothetical protein